MNFIRTWMFVLIIAAWEIGSLTLCIVGVVLLMNTGNWLFSVLPILGLLIFTGGLAAFTSLYAR